MVTVAEQEMGEEEDVEETGRARPRGGGAVGETELEVAIHQSDEAERSGTGEGKDGLNSDREDQESELGRTFELTNGQPFKIKAVK